MFFLRSKMARKYRAGKWLILWVVPLLILFSQPVYSAPPAHPGTVIIPAEKRSEGLNRPVRTPKKNRKTVKPKPPEKRQVSSGLVAAPLGVVQVPGFADTEKLQPLFLLLSFSDQAFSSTTAVNYPSFLFTDSPGFAEYYRVASGGKLELGRAAADPVVLVNMPQTYSYYVSSQSGFGTYPQDNRGMVEDALDQADTVQGIDFSAFDNDGPDGVPGSPDDDGIVDALVVVHAGPAAEYFIQPEALNHMASHYDSFPGGQEWTADGVTVLDWAMAPERDPDSTDGDGSHSRGTAGTYQQTLGTLVHEFGHILGLPDLYDPDLASNGLGHYDLMSYGLYGMKTHVDLFTASQSSWDYPGLPSAWSRTYLGWVEPVAIHADTAFQLWRAQDPEPVDYPQVVKVWSSSSWGALTPWSPAEYFILEHRQNGGANTYDGGFNFDNEGAVLIYHVDETVLMPGGILAAYPNDNPNLKGVDLEEADSNADLDNTNNFGDFLNYPVGGIQGDFYRSGGNDDFWRFSNPGSNDNANQVTGVDLVNGVGPLSDADLADYLMTVDFVTNASSTTGYTGTDRAGPFVLASGTFDDGNSDPWVKGGRNVLLSLGVRHNGLPNMARSLEGMVIEDADHFSVLTSPVPYGDLPSLVETTGSGSYLLRMNNPAGAFSWVPVNVQFTDANDNLSVADFDLPVVRSTGVNSAPAAVADSYGVDEDNTLEVPGPGVLGNDSDFDSDVLAAVLGSSPTHGTLSLGAPGSFSYQPDADYSGTDSFTYLASDGDLDSAPAAVTITVSPVDDDSPTAVADSANVDEDGSVNTDVLFNDSGLEDQPVTVTEETAPSSGSLVVESDNTITYIPVPDFFGSDSYVYRVTDLDGDFDTATVTVTVNPLNDAPEAVDDTYSVVQDNTLSVPAPGVLSNDTDPDGDPLTTVTVAGPVHGALVLSTDGGFVYTPMVGYTGTDTFTYRSRDGFLDSTMAVVTITVSKTKKGGSGGGCFIATAAYGSVMEPEVQLLRDYRDRYLKTRAWGRLLLRLYYKISPAPAAFIADRPALKGFVRAALHPIVEAAGSAQGKGGPIPVLIGILILLLPPMMGMYFTVYFLRRRRARKFLGS
jgi:M6 family metalloprotease-like protein